MNWIIALILLLIVAYLLYVGMRARHVARCKHDERTTEHVPDVDSSANGPNADSTNHGDLSPNRSELEKVPAPHDAPSLLYADKPDQDGDAPASGNAEPLNNNNERATAAHTQVAADTQGPAATLDNTHAAVATQKHAAQNKKSMDKVTQSLDVDSPAPSDFPRDPAGYPLHVNNDQQNPSAASNAANNPTNDTANAGVGSSAVGHASETGTNKSNDGSQSGSAALAAGGVATAAGIAAAATWRQSSATPGEAADSDNSSHAMNGTMASDIDLELGDSTVENDTDHDELLDFGDLTADISEMLKELNLRESDSPRLEINESEYKQLKTGDPGEVKPEKIENVAGKLRNMLQ